MKIINADKGTGNQGLKCNLIGILTGIVFLVGHRVVFTSTKKMYACVLTDQQIYF